VPEFNCVVETPRGLLTLPWDARSALVDRMRGLDAAAGAVRAFEAAGASERVTLEPVDADAVVEVVNAWMREVDGPENLPEGIVDLRNAFADFPGQSTTSR
jgi:hypothetical protein